MNTDMLWLLALGAGGGLLHALDADHILAVSTVAAGGDASRRRVLRTALNWALGHGLSLALVTLSVLGFGLAIPEALSSVAELLVGVVLLAAGLSLLRAGWRGEVAVSLHRHRGLPAHVHLHGRDHIDAQGARGLVDHRPVLIGIIHGIAGSAPLLALLPLVIQAQFMLAGLYILLFTLCVALAMCAFGGLLGVLVSGILRRSRRAFDTMRALLGLYALGFGAFWLHQAL